MRPPRAISIAQLSVSWSCAARPRALSNAGRPHTLIRCTSLQERSTVLSIHGIIRRVIIPFPGLSPTPRAVLILLRSSGGQPPPFPSTGARPQTAAGHAPGRRRRRRYARSHVAAPLPLTLALPVSSRARGRCWCGLGPRRGCRAPAPPVFSELFVVAREADAALRPSHVAPL